MTWFRHQLLNRPLTDPWEAFRLANQLQDWARSELPASAKIFTGAESAGHDTHAAREIKKAKRR